MNRTGHAAKWLATVLILNEALVAVAVAVYLRVNAANRLSDALDPSAIQIQQVNGQATLDLLLVLVIAAAVIAATASIVLVAGLGGSAHAAITSTDEIAVQRARGTA